MPERAPMTEAELLELIGDPDEVARGLEEFSGFARTFEANRDRLLREHPDMWVAVCRDGTLVAETQAALLAELDRRSARRHAYIKFMDTQPRIRLPGPIFIKEATHQASAEGDQESP